MHGLIGDFLRHLDRLPQPMGPRLVAFIGGTIGNFRPHERRELLGAIARELGPGGHLLLGTDLVKDRAVLEAAYNDARGVSAQFNRNILAVLNRELGAHFDPQAFDYVASFDDEHEWIDMRLRSRAAQDVEVPAIGLVRASRRGRGDPHRDQREVHTRARVGRPARRRPRAGGVVHRPAGDGSR